MIEKIKSCSLGVFVVFIMSAIIILINKWIPLHVISNGVLAMLIGMILNPYISKYTKLLPGLNFISKKLLRLSIILMGLSLSFRQVIQVGKYSLIVMVFTLLSAFGFGYLLGRLLKLNWKLSGLISAGTGICGASAVMAIAPTIKAKNRDIAYAISATFIFDVLMIIVFPMAGRYLGMSDLGYGLWTGTAVNDTSSVVAASYAFSEAAGNFAMIVKLTRTLSIVPTVLIFSYINNRLERIEAEKENDAVSNNISKKTNVFEVVKNTFPVFILFFLVMVALKSTGLVSDQVSHITSIISKFMMVMVLLSIGLKTNLKEMFSAGLNPMVHGFLVSAIVVIVSYLVQSFVGQI